MQGGFTYLGLLQVVNCDMTKTCYIKNPFLLKQLRAHVNMR